jgi:hypothetical protein
VTSVIRTQLTGLGRTIADLRERVRVAVAGELGRAVAGAVQQVVQAVVAGRSDPRQPEPPPAYRRSDRWGDEDEHDRWDRPRDPWADDPDEEYGRDRDRDRMGRRSTPDRHEPSPADRPEPDPGVTAAVAAGVFAARWWLVRRGTLLAAVGLGLGIGLLGVLGGPIARTAVATLAATADILSATDALGGGAARLDHF